MDRPSENDSVVILAGRSVTVEHDGELSNYKSPSATSIEPTFIIVSAVYDFSASGPGTFTFDPVSRFQVTELDGDLKATSDTTHIDITNTRTISITVTGVSKRELQFKKHRVVCEDHGRNSTITAGLSEAGWIASLAVAYINSRGAKDQLYKDYFGSNSNSTIIDNFNRILKPESTGATMFCSDPDQSCLSSDVSAYTTPSAEGIFYCDSFYSQLSLYSLCRGETTVNARKIRGGTTLRMLASVLIPGVADNGRTCIDNQGLTDPQKVSNAGNYEVSTKTLRCLPRALRLT